MTTTRRTALLGALALPFADTLPAIAAEPDPIFSLIEAHKKALQAFEDVIDAQNAAETARSDLAPFEQAWDVASAAENEARYALATTEPTTIGGIVAVLAYVRGREHRGEFLLPDEHVEFELSIEIALREIAGMEEIETEAA